VSDRQIAKNRWHRAVSAYVRTTLRKVGISVDEEAAQFALGGNLALSGQAEEYIRRICNEALDRRHELARTWEAEHPGVNPFPPSFPERCLKLVREALTACYEDDGTPAYHLERLKLMCERELELDPATTESPEE
jgi:hypothetical protein